MLSATSPQALINICGLRKILVIFQKINLNMGREEGVQQAFRKNGALFANYEAKDGRIFGLKRATLCFSLEEEDIQDEP